MVRSLCVCLWWEERERNVSLQFPSVAYEASAITGTSSLYPSIYPRIYCISIWISWHEKGLRHPCEFRLQRRYENRTNEINTATYVRTSIVSTWFKFVTHITFMRFFCWNSRGDEKSFLKMFFRCNEAVLTCFHFDSAKRTLVFVFVPIWKHVTIRTQNDCKQIRICNLT